MVFFLKTKRTARHANRGVFHQAFRVSAQKGMIENPSTYWTGVMLLHPFQPRLLTCWYLRKSRFEIFMKIILKNVVFFFEGGRLLDVFVQFSMHGIFKSPWKRHLVDVCSLFSISLLSRKIEHINPPDHVCGHAFVTVTIQPYAADVSGGFLAQGWCQSQSDDHMRADGFVLAPLKGVTQT